MSKPFRAAVGLTVALSTLAGCQANVDSESAPVVVIPSGIVSTQTAEQVTRKMLDEIHANERRLGRVLAPARIIRVQLLRAGEMYPARKLDGTNPDADGLGPPDGPGWVVEAVATFPDYDPITGQLDSLSMHEYHEWDDAGAETVITYPCWVRGPRPPEGFDGHC